MSMSADVIARAANAMPPMSGNTAVLSVTDTVARFIIPTTWAGKYCTFQMVGAKADINFGSSSVTCVYGQASTVSTEAITLHTSSGRHMEDLTEYSWQMPEAERATHFAVDCVGSGSGKLYITLG